MGSTRERDPDQDSTEKFAIFLAVTGMSFITVDMDPLNTNRAERTTRTFNSRAKAVTARGEQNGMVVIDDTWLDDNGVYVGKGKLAVSLLLAAGFRISNNANRSVALVKNETSQPSAD